MTTSVGVRRGRALSASLSEVRTEAEPVSCQPGVRPGDINVNTPVFSTIIGPAISMFGSHWLNLDHSVAIKNQLKTSKDLTGHILHYASSLWNKGGIQQYLGSNLDFENSGLFYF